MLAPDQELVKIARVLKSNGTDGEVVMGFREISPEEIDLEEPVFIYFDGSPVPFFVENFSQKGAGKALVRLTGVRNVRDAEEIVGQDVYVEAGSLFEGEDDDMDLSVLVGWTLYDGKKKVGQVVDFMDIPGNPCLEAKTKNGTAMIPFHENLIISLNPDAQEIVMNLPAGLI